MSDQPAVPFILSCIHCDAGDGIETAGQARYRGWRMVSEDTDHTSDHDDMPWTWLGLCPDCQKDDEEHDAAERERVRTLTAIELEAELFDA